MMASKQGLAILAVRIAHLVARVLRIIPAMTAHRTLRATPRHCWCGRHSSCCSRSGFDGKRPANGHPAVGNQQLQIYKGESHFAVIAEEAGRSDPAGAPRSQHIARLRHASPRHSHADQGAALQHGFFWKIRLNRVPRSRPSPCRPTRRRRWPGAHSEAALRQPFRPEPRRARASFPARRASHRSRRRRAPPSCVAVVRSRARRRRGGQRAPLRPLGNRKSARSRGRLNPRVTEDP